MLGNEPNLLSEIRAPGGMLIASALVMLLGVVRQKLTWQALILAALLYGSYGVSRLLSMLLDGVPTGSLFWAAVLELIIGSLCVVTVLRFDTNQSMTTRPDEAQ
jgi:peptidoglycan/LPS O-acetylase OafA/YrhL